MITLMSSNVRFDYQKATQAINFFARKGSGLKINKMLVLKLIWATDRYHLRKYGRPVIGDEYVAMSFGPVPSGVKDIAEGSGILADEESTYSKEFIGLTDSYTIQSRKEPDLDVFSDSDLEALEFAYKSFGADDKYVLVNVTHQYPEWKKFGAQIESGQITRAFMDYSDFFLNPDALAQDKFAMDMDLISQSRVVFEESAKLQSISW